jgi:hypothetical protein
LQNLSRVSEPSPFSRINRLIVMGWVVLILWGPVGFLVAHHA